MGELLYFEDLSMGDRWGSPWRQVTEGDVMQFANLTGDFDPLHIDEDFAERTPFRERIAHGVLGLSLLTGIGSVSPRVETVALVEIRDWRFHKPIYFGDSVHVMTTVVGLDGSGRRRGRVSWHRQLVNQDNIVVQEGTLVTLIASRSGSVRETVTHAAHLTSPATTSLPN